MKLRHFLLVLFAFFMITLLGCSQNKGEPENHLVFKGESSNWSGELIVKLDGTMENKTFVLKYKGKENDELGTVTYSYKTSSSLVSASEKIQKGIITSASNTNTLLSRDETIDVTVEWNKLKENFKMQNEL